MLGGIECNINGKRMLIRKRNDGIAFIFMYIFIQDKNISIVISSIIDWTPIHLMNGHSLSKYDIHS